MINQPPCALCRYRSLSQYRSGALWLYLRAKAMQTGLLSDETLSGYFEGRLKPSFEQRPAQKETKRLAQSLIDELLTFPAPSWNGDTVEAVDYSRKLFAGGEGINMHLDITTVTMPSFGDGRRYNVPRGDIDRTSEDSTDHLAEAMAYAHGIVLDDPVGVPKVSETAREATARWFSNIERGRGGTSREAVNWEIANGRGRVKRSSMTPENWASLLSGLGIKP